MKLHQGLIVALCLSVLLWSASAVDAASLRHVLVLDPTYTTVPDPGHPDGIFGWLTDAIGGFCERNPSWEFGLLVANIETDQFAPHNFGTEAEPLWMADWGDLVAAISPYATLETTGIGVDGHHGIEMASTLYPNDGGLNIMFVSDGPWTDWPDADPGVPLGDPTAPGGGGGFSPVMVNVIIDHGFGDDGTAMGIRGDTTAITATGDGGFEFTVYGLDPARTTGGAYIPIAGSAWDMLAAQASGDDLESFRQGFSNVKISEFGGGGSTGPGGGGAPGGGGDEIPEPGTWILLLSGAALLMARRRRSSTGR